MPVTTTGMVKGPRFARIAFTTHGQPRPSTRFAGPPTRFAGPPLRSGPSDDCRGRPCGKPLRASRKAGPRSTACKCDACDRSSVAEHRRHPPDGITCAFPVASDGQGIQTPRATAADPAHVAVISTRCGSKQAPLRSIAQATLSRRSATERRARACPWPRARSDRYLSWLTGSRWAATRAQW